MIVAIEGVRVSVNYNELALHMSEINEQLDYLLNEILDHEHQHNTTGGSDQVCQHVTVNFDNYGELVPALSVQDWLEVFRLL